MKLKEFLALPETDQILHANIAGLFIDEIDWNNAKMLQGECDKNQFEDAIEEVAVAMKEDLEWFEEWVDYLLHEITALHIITACMLAKNLLETG